jgi:hypothetical protein
MPVGPALTVGQRHESLQDILDISVALVKMATANFFLWSPKARYQKNHQPGPKPAYIIDQSFIGVPNATIEISPISVL